MNYVVIFELRPMRWGWGASRVVPVLAADTIPADAEELPCYEADHLAFVQHVQFGYADDAAARRKAHQFAAEATARGDKVYFFID